MICTACPRKCGINRAQAMGFCQSPKAFRLARAALHFWEEPCISGKGGSGAVFFSGCSLRCVYCQNYEISRQGKGVEVSDAKLIAVMQSLVDAGAENINFVNPTHYAMRLAGVLSRWKPPVPVVYNSSGYENIETIRALTGLVDIYLPDFKYSREDKAERYSGAAGYFETTAAAIAEMRRQVPDRFENGMMKSGVLVRHLVLPGNTNSALEIIDYMRTNFPGTWLSLMAQYTPVPGLEAYPEINRRLTRREYNKVCAYAEASGLQNVYVQEQSAVGTDFIPPFDFTGIL